MTILSPVTWMVPPVPFLLETSSLPETLTVCGGNPATFVVEPPSTILPLRVPTERASITPVLLMTESTTVRACAAVSSTRPPVALELAVVL